MGQVITIGLDIAKSVFQVLHGVDAAGEVVMRRQLRRAQLLAFFGKQPACLVGIEACASAHHWARELREFGHQVRLMPASYVKPYVKRQKNDAADAEAIREAGDKGCDGRTGQQDRTNGVEDHDQRRALSRAARSAGIAIRRRRADKLRKGAED